MSVGTNIRRFRKAKGLTQKQLAELINVSTITIQRYEAEKFKPKTEHLESIAKCLGISVDELIDFNIYEYWDKKYDPDQISKEVIALEAVDDSFGKDVTGLITDYLSLNDLGKQKAAEYVSDLTEQKKYKK